MSGELIVGIDTGGTFTDCVYRSRGRLRVLKLRSMPDDPGRAILTAVEMIVGESGGIIAHSSNQVIALPTLPSSPN